MPVLLIPLLFSPDNVADYVFPMLSFEILSDFESSSPRAKKAVLAYRRRKLEVSMRRFWSPQDFDALLALLHHTGGLVVGSVALESLTRPLPNSSFEVAVCRELVAIIGHFFLSVGLSYRQSDAAAAEGWIGGEAFFFDIQNSNPSTSEHRSYTRTVNGETAVADVYTFESEDGTVYQLIAANRHPLEVVLGMANTLHMCFLSSTHLVSLYKNATFKNRVCLDFTEPATRMLSAHTWYFDNPVSVNPVSVAEETVNTSDDFSILPRQVGDEFCLVVPLKERSFARGSLGLGRQAMVFCHSWQLAYDQHLARVTWTVVQAHTLKQAYLIATPIYEALLFNVPLRLFRAVFIFRRMPKIQRRFLDSKVSKLLRTAFGTMVGPNGTLSMVADSLSQPFTSFRRENPGLPLSQLPTAAVGTALFNFVTSIPSVLASRADVFIRLDEPGPAEGSRAWTHIAVAIPEESEGGQEPRLDQLFGMRNLYLDTMELTLNIIPRGFPFIRYYFSRMTDFGPSPVPIQDNLVGVLNGVFGCEASGLEAAVDMLDINQIDVLDKVVHLMLHKEYINRFIDQAVQQDVVNPNAQPHGPTTSITCPCGRVLTLPTPEDRWYAVTVGLRIGFVKGWENVKSLVLHVSGNKYYSCDSKESARKVFLLAMASGNVGVSNSVDRPVVYSPVPRDVGMLFP
ncbi:hypothetical protein VNI00_017203 [Paramarasmius palmivorus]|uniref:Uncharacterized protein n=1 Tax=Paramarasmius palmivorus TaxID=297713 RepID=A0AAW0B700_9AGAR